MGVDLKLNYRNDFDEYPLWKAQANVRCHQSIKFFSRYYKRRSFIGFVPQEDMMYRELTVRENILHSARMRLPSTWTGSEIDNLVDNVLDILNLSQIPNSTIGDEKVQGISGGQRKRINIGMELVSTLLCLFLDEPTSGLDAAAALEITELLAKISKIGVTVIAVIHQPRTEIFYKFNEGLLLTRAGKVAFWGSTKDISSLRNIGL